MFAEHGLANPLERLVIASSYRRDTELQLMIHSNSERQPFLTKFSNGDEVAWSDTTADKGGGGQGFRPHELLEAALATCMNISLRMYAEKHGIALAGATVKVTLDRNSQQGQTFVYTVGLSGSLSEAQTAALLTCIESCPVRTTLSKGFRFTLAAD